MRLILISTLCLFLSFQMVGQNQCLPDGIVFSSQQEVDDFRILYPDCTEILGDVTFENGDDITNFDNISNIETIGKSLIIRNLNNLTNLNGLENLISIGTGLLIENNENLESFEGLNQMKTLASSEESKGFLTVVNNPNLLSIEALAGFTIGNQDVRGPIHLDIKNNSALTSISALSNLTSLQTMEILDNESLESLSGLENIENITERISIINNDKIEDLNGLSSLERTFRDVTIFTISDNDALQSISGLNNFNFLWLRRLIIQNNPNLNTCQSNNLCRLFLEKDSTHYEIFDNDFGCSLDELQFNCEDALKRCLPGNLTINWPNESFTEYSEPFPFCEEILGSLNFEATHISHDAVPGDGFLQLKKLHGNLTMFRAFGRNTNRINLDGFNNLEYIGGSVNIQGGGAFTGGTLTSSGFQSLDTIARNLTYQSDDGGSEELGAGALDALSNIKFIGGDLTLAGRMGGDFSQLAGLKVNGRLILRNNNILFNTTSSIAGIGEMDLSEINSLTLTGFSNVNFCSYPNICEYLAAGGSATIGSPFSFGPDFNGQGCNSRIEILEGCKAVLPFSKFLVFIDENQNKIFDSNERLHETSQFDFLNEGIKVFTFGDGYTFYGAPGDYEVQYVQDPNWELTTDFETIEYSLDAMGFNEQFLFGITPRNLIQDANSLVLTHEIRCNTEAEIEVFARNTGTTPISGTLWLEIDQRIQDLQFIDQPDFQNGNRLGWNFDNLVAGGIESKKLNISVPGPPVDLPIGSKLIFNSNIEIRNGATVGQFEHEHLVLCSYDPNDKLVSPIHPYFTNEPVDTSYLSLLDQDFTYTVRFQNTGNADALQVIIRDTLDQNLDVSSFRLISSSHPENLTATIEFDKNLIFNFQDINLPPESVDEQGSNGYVTFTIRHKENIPEGTVIPNTAHIYFDNNPPIVTNTTENTMVRQLPETSSIQNLDNQLNINIFPNPTDGKIYLQGDNLLNAKVTVSDVTGRLILIEKLNGTNEIQLPENIAGLLLLKIETEDGVAVRRVFKN